jgi:hypothetical protein
MSRTRLAVCVLFFAVCSLIAPTLMHAQYRTSIQGVVTDSTGAVVPGATLTLTDPATNATQVRTSNDDGIFNFNALANTQYRLEVERQGFKKKVLDNVQLIREQANALNVELEVGSESTTVNVNASEAPAIDTQTASLNGVISSNQIQHMPSFGRDVLKLTRLAPGMSADGSQAGGGGSYNLVGTQSGPTPSGGSTGIFATENLVQGYSNGNEAQNTGISIDGISTTSAVWGGATNITPSEDSLEDVKVVTNSYDAEDGRFTGAQLKITSKAGTNQYHGSLFYTLHSPGLNAYQHFFGTSTSPQRDNTHFHQFGGSVGGPILKNKIFAFFNYETVRQPFSSIPGSGWYDTAAFDALAPSGSIAAQYLSFPGNGVIGTINPTGSTCGNIGLNEGVNCVTIAGQGINIGTPLNPSLFPLGQNPAGQDPGWTNSFNPGTGGDGSGGPENLGTVADFANYNTINPTKFTAVQYNGRLDYDVTGKDRIGFAIYWVPLSKTNYNGNRGYDIFHHTQTNNAFSAIWNHTFSPSLLNEFRVNAAGWRWNEVASNPQSPVGLPVDNIENIGLATVNQFGPSVGSILNQWTYGYKDVATKIYGRHTIKFGGEATRLFYLQDCAGCGVPSYRFFNLWDFLNDVPHQENGGFNPANGEPTTIRQDQRENILGFFVQDDVKVRPNLTLNLGLRWSYFGPLYSKQDNMLRAIPGSGADYLTGLVIRKGNSWDAQKNNFSPEIGFAWSPAMANGKLVFRGGYGLNYNQEEIAISANISNNPGLVTFPSLYMGSPSSPNPGILYAVSSGIHNLYGYPANTATESTPGPNGLPTSGSVGIQLFPGTLPTMRVHHYSFDMQYDIGYQFVASLGYQGSVSRDLFFHEEPNAVAAIQGLTLNPQVAGYSDYWNVNGHSNYNAMMAELKHNFSRQFMADAQYTWAKSMDVSSAPYSQQPYPYDPNLGYGRSDFNIAHTFKLFGMWQPVFFHGSNGWMEKIAGGWSISGIFDIHSGFPWTPVLNTQGGPLYCGDCYAYSVLWPAAYLGGAGGSTSNKAFETPTSSNFPNGAQAYFTFPTYTSFGCGSSACYGSTPPQSPGIQRNSFNLPGYKALDLTVAKGFGFPNMRVLGENAKLELRLNAYNVFNNLNLNPNNIQNNIGNPGSNNTAFGTITGALAARVLDIGLRFSF